MSGKSNPGLPKFEQQKQGQLKYVFLLFWLYAYPFSSENSIILIYPVEIIIPNASNSYEFPTPDNIRICGELIAPPANITSFFEKILLTLLLFTTSTPIAVLLSSKIILLTKIQMLLFGMGKD